ncbi:MAG: flagellar filament capping protein FliD [Candidatus Didemnitutus sp.]|nr:flagellar filament capping protein FliD [Candidatus Didemnitutus sp.]
MAGLQLSGLASGFDWKSLVDNIMNLERTPINRIEADKRTNTARSTAISDLSTRLTTLKTATSGLQQANLFSSRKTTSSSTTGAWPATGAASSAPGSYKFTVSQLATVARRVGVSDIGVGLNDSSDVSGLTLANLRTGTPVTAGTFSVNGAKVTVALTDSLQEVFAAINTATGGDVTAAYNEVTDKITLTSGSLAEITLGAANDTSNILSVLKLANNTSSSITSAGALGVLKTSSTIASAGLRTTITAVDGDGAGTFSINGVAVDYNVNNDTLSAVIKRINQSTAGVTASYDSVSDRMLLTNNTTGDVGIAVSESAGGLLGALGLGSGATLTRGKDALFTLNDGSTRTSRSNTLTSAAHGITGLSVTATTEETQTITITSDTEAMGAKIKEFLTAYNAVQNFIEDKTKSTTTGTKVTTAVLSSNREVQGWARELRALSFGAVSGATGTINRLDHLGITTTGIGLTLSITDETKFNNALRDKPTEVEALFQKSSTGFAAKFVSTIDRLSASSKTQVTQLARTNTDLDRQVADLERHLETRRELMTATFIKMEEAQSNLQQQGNALTNAFFKNSSK